MRKREQELVDAVLECYRRMYKEATPSADIDEIIKSGEGQTANWFLSYSLPINRQNEIVENICNEIKASKRERRLISISIHLGSAPRCGVEDDK